MKCSGGTLQQDVEEDEREAEDAEGESSCSYRCYAGELEDEKLECGPYGKCDCRIEVAAPVPVAGKVMANSGVAVPAFVGVLGPVHPGRAVGEVCGEMEKVERKEHRRYREQEQAWQMSESCEFVRSTARHRLQCT